MAEHAQPQTEADADADAHAAADAHADAPTASAASDKSEPGDPLLGTLLDERYLLQRLLGKGAQGAVYLAQQTETERQVAVKVLSSQAFTEPARVRRFQHEAKIQSQLDHPGLAKVLAFGIVESRTCYIVMEYLQGITLKALLERDGELPTALCVELFKQIARAVAYAHQMNVLHRDLKPENVFVGERDMQMKILDFGLSKLLGVDEQLQQKLTGTGAIIGTPAYMAPERWHSAAPDLRTDVYSFGSMLYEALSGSPLFTCDSYIELMAAHADRAPRSIPIPAGDKVRANLGKIALKCLAKQPIDRFQSMDDVLRAMENVNADESEFEAALGSMAPTGSPVPRRPVNQAAKHRMLLMAGAILSVIGALVATFVAIQTNGANRPAEMTPADYVMAGQMLRERAMTAAEGSPMQTALLIDAAKKFQVAEQATTDQFERRRYLDARAFTLSYASLPKEAHVESAQCYVECANIDIQLLEKPANNQATADTVFRHHLALFRAAEIYMFLLNDLESGKKQAERIRTLEQRTGTYTYLSAWPLEMVARYSRRPEQAKLEADAALKSLNAFPGSVAPEEAAHYFEDAVIDYVATGMSVKDAKARIRAISAGCIDFFKSRKRRDIYKLLDEDIPDGSEAKLTPAYRQKSRVFSHGSAPTGGANVAGGGANSSGANR